MRNTGIDIIGTVPWGTHFCQFYRNRRELTEILVPYFKAGLEANESCVWIASPELSVRQAKAALRRAVPQMNDYIKSGQLEILPHTQWYLTQGELDVERVLDGWVQKLAAARERGFAGLRLSGDGAWVSEHDRERFAAYEQAVNDTIERHEMVALCTYHLDRCGPVEILDVMRAHQFALVFKKKNWEVIESSNLARAREKLSMSEKRARDAIRESEERLRILGDNLLNSLVYQYTHENGKPKFLYISAGCERLNGVTAEEVLADAGAFHRQLDPVDLADLIEAEKKSAAELSPFEREVPFRLPDGRIRWMHLRSKPRRLPSGQVIWDGVQTDITDRKRAEEALRESEERVRLAVSAAEMGAWDYNLATGVLTWDARTREMFGVAPDADVNYELFLTRVHPDDRERVNGEIRYVLDSASGGLFDSQYRTVETAERGSRWIRATGRVTLNAAGQAIRFSGTVHDITREKNYEQQLQESRAKLQAALASMTDAVFISDVEGRFIQFNDAFVTFHRFKTREECANTYQGYSEILEFRYPDGTLRPLDMWAIPRALRGESVANDEYTVRRKDTGETWIGSYSYGPIRDHAGNITGAVVTARDITGQKRAQEALAQAKRDMEAERDTLQAVMNGARNSHLVYLDPDFKYVRVNEVYAQSCGYTSEQMIGLNLFALYPSPEMEAIARQVRETGEPASGRDSPFEFPDQPERGLTYWDWTLSAVKDHAGGVVGLIFSLYETTERKKTEEDLQFALDQLELAHRAAGAGAWDWNIIAGTFDWSDKMYALFGLDPDKADASFESWRGTLHPEDRGKAEALIEQAINQHTALASEYRVVWPNGQVRWISAMGEAFYNAEGQPARMSGICTDITERKRAEEELRQSREWLRVTLASIGDAVVATDASGKITFINPVAVAMTGCPTEQALGRRVEEVIRIVNEETGEQVEDMVASVLRMGSILSFSEHTSLTRMDGATVPVEDSAAPIRDEKGNVAGVVLVFHDVTEKRRVQKALTESEKEMRLVMDSVPALIAYVGTDMRYLRVNKGFEEMIGRPSGEIVGHHVREFIGEEAWPRVQKMLERVYAGETVVYEHRLEWIEGRPWGQVILVPDRDAAGRVQGHVVHIMDISNRKQAEEELAALQRRQAMILGSIADGFFSIDRDWRIIHINDATLRYYSKSREDVIGRTLQEIFPEIIGRPLENNFRQAMETGEPVHFIEPSLILKGRIVEMNVYPGPDNLTALFRDVTERIAREAELHKLNRTLNALSHSDSAMMRAMDEPGYVAEVCRLVVEDCGHALVWVGYAENDEAKTVRPIAFSGFDEEYIKQLNISWGENERAHGPTGTAIRTGRPYICRNIETDPTFGPWREQALKRGYASAAVMPLNAEGRTIGVLSIYSQVVDSFSEEETRLLLRLAEDLAHGIQNLRVRDARLRAEAQLKANLARFELLADSAGRFLQAFKPQEIVGSVCDRAMKLLDCHAFFNFLLDDASERLHMNAYAGIAEEDAQADEWLVYGTTISGTVARDGIEIVVGHVQQSTDPRTGRIRRFGLTAYACFPMLGPGGKVIGTLGFGTRSRETLSESDLSLMRAITDQVTVAMVRVKVEKDLRTSQAELVELNRTLEDRIAERTSQLDKLNADLERRAHQLRALAQELTETEERERRRLADILHDDLQQLLVGAKLHLGLLTSRFPQAYGSELIAQITKMLDESIGKSRGLAQELSPPLLHQQGLVATLDWLGRQMKAKYGLNVRLTAAFNVDAPEPLKVFLFRAAQEMLFNVVKHAGVNDASVEVEHVTGMVRLKVSDQGKGFAVEHGLPANWGTSGFGLFSIHERANLLGGRLMIEAAPGLGSHFTLEIPIEPSIAEAEAEAAEEEVQAIAALPPAEGAKGPRIRVLLVDDHQVMRQGLAAMLFNAPDLEVVGEAEDGRQAVDMVQACQPDVVIMDVSMPIMDGIEATRVIKREWPGMRIIGLSMFEEEDLAKAMIDAGAESYLSKALGLKELIDVIRKPRVPQA